MSTTRRTGLGMRPAAIILTLALAAVTAPVLMLPRVAGSAPTPLPCTVTNANGCTELSPIPPEDTAAVPPNFMLMLDDSGSMNWDYMPDWTYLSDNSNSPALNNTSNTRNGLRDVAVNGLYYDPTYTYVPPPKADGTSYPTPPGGMRYAYFDGFNTSRGTKNVAAYQASYTGDLTGQPFPYYTTLVTNSSSQSFPPVWVCPTGYTSTDPVTSTTICTVINPNPPPPVSQVTTWVCHSGDGSPDMHYTPPRCTHVDRSGEVPVTTYYDATQRTSCPSGSSLQSDGLCHYPAPAPTKPATPTCPNPPGGSWNAGLGMCVKTTTASFNAFTYVTGTKGNYTQHYVALAANDCSAVLNTAQAATCVSETDTSGVAAPAGVPAGQNIANWFSYYRTRMLMTKSSMMLAFSSFNPKYRFGFGSINGNGVSVIPGSPGGPAGPTAYQFNDLMAPDASGFSPGGSATNQLAVVQPFGDGSSGTQKANFWNWLVAEQPSNQTPLRMSLDAVGQYYMTDQPWSSMTGDPGYTASSDTQFACRASFTLLTTDGFWNGDDPTTAGLTGAASTNGPVNSVPADDVTQYLAQPPFSGGAADAGPSLADVAAYYWANDLQPGLANVVSTTPTAPDPAAWQHMTTYTIGMGFDPVNIQPPGPPPPTPAQIFAWAHGGALIPGFAWPTPSRGISAAGIALGSENNIADLVHAAVTGHGDFFNVHNPTDLANAINKVVGDIEARPITPPPAAMNASVLSLGALSFSTGNDRSNWTGTLEGVTLNPDGTVNQTLWRAGANLNADFYGTGFSSRKVFTSAYDPTKPTPFSAFQFAASDAAKLDGTEETELGGDPLCPAGNTDTLCNRINYLLGDPTNEGTLYRTRSGLLGAIIRSQPVYVAGATGTYYNRWPSFGGIAAPENATGVQTYDQFVTQEASRAGTVYIGANDGMLHAFDAPVPTGCTYTGSPPVQTCATYAPSSSAGHERWAFIPRAVYANLGNLTDLAHFNFLPTVDATPVTRDVFFSQGGAGNDKWHTILVGGVGLGGRGVYALDVTDPTAWDSGYPMSSYPASGVLWEFDADMTAASLAPTGGCVASYDSCRPSDLGFTVPQPNIGRLADGRWVVIVSNGYFPDCTTPDTPTGSTAACQAIAAQAPRDSSGNPYSALFVLDAETGKMIAELKTPTGISGVTSFGLSSPVLGDYQNDQVDDVAFAGDVQGNLWRFDMSDPSPSNWKVTLVYKGGTSVDPVTGDTTVQSITSMPRLFPDPTTNRFMVVFGTGRFLGVGDNSDNTTQSVYGVRDVLGETWVQHDLTPQYLHEEVAPALLPDGTPNPLAGASLRCVTGGASDTCDTPTPVATVPGSSGGWYINLYTTTSDGTRNDAGERVVVTPGAIFASNTAVIGTLITGSQTTDACSPTTQGAILALNATTGGSAGVSGLGGGQIAGGRITHAPTSGSLPIASALGGGRAYLPGMTLAPTGASVFSVDAPMWRRRSWSEINQNQ